MANPNTNMLYDPLRIQQLQEILSKLTTPDTITVKPIQQPKQQIKKRFNQSADSVPQHRIVPIQATPFMDRNQYMQMLYGSR